MVFNAGIHTVREKELRVGVHQAFGRNGLEFLVIRLKAYNIALIHAVLHRKESTQRLALNDRIPLLRPVSRNGLYHVQRFGTQTPVGIAQIEERRTVVIHKVPRARGGLYKTAFINFQAARIIGTGNAARLIMQAGILGVSAYGFIRLGAGGGAYKANAPHAAAVPETGNRIGNAAVGQNKVYVHIIKRVIIKPIAYQHHFIGHPGNG